MNQSGRAVRVSEKFATDGLIAPHPGCQMADTPLASFIWPVISGRQLGDAAAARGIAARESLRYLDNNEIDADRQASKAELS